MLIIAGLINVSGTQSRELLFYAEPIIIEFIGGIVIFYLMTSEFMKNTTVSAKID